MNRLIQQILILCIIPILFFSCKKKTCDSVKIGEISPPANFYDYIVHDKGEVVAYEDIDGHELNFRIDTFMWNGRINYDKIGEEETEQDGTFNCYEYKSTPWGVIQFEDLGEEEYTLQIQVRPMGETEETLVYILDIFSSWIIREPVQITGGSFGEYNITTYEVINISNSTVTSEKLDTWEENGKVFNDVVSFTKDADELYFVAGIGIVGFTGIDGALFTIVQ